MSRKAKFSVWVAAFIFAAAFALPGGRAAAASLEALDRAAKKEGKVSFGGAMKGKETKALLKVFQKKFPGIAVDYLRKSTGPMVQVVEAERMAGKVSFDLVNITEPGDALRWKKDGFSGKVAIIDADKMIPDIHDADGYYAIVGMTTMPGIYNTKKLSAAEAPKSLKELDDPKWVGKIVISRPSRGGTGTSALLNVVDQLGPGFMKKAKEMNILLTRGNAGALRAVSSGERPLSWGISGYRASAAKNKGASIELIFWKEGVPIAAYFGIVPKKAAHPNAGKLLLNWYLSREGQTLVVKKIDLYTVRKDVKATPKGMPPFDKFKARFFKPERMAEEGKRVAGEFDKIMGLK